MDDIIDYNYCNDEELDIDPCDGEFNYDEKHCPQRALDICCTGGNILKYKL